MKITVEYGENIIVAVVHPGKFGWYVTEKDYWYLDLPMLENEAVQAGSKVFNLGNYSSRFDISRLDESTASNFLAQIADLKADVHELREKFFMDLDTGSDKRDDLELYAIAIC
ncbi:hypothetical protein [Paenibacillus hemerocallicola]|uniref:hypothetical protein n=1 Tax=Paenibacillus hemerocallicola TaxID=1172614 RepID=UPI001FE4B763|nr:hypothetical protein [Paenibacillus hemerocallicola]